MTYNPKPYDGDSTLEELERRCEIEQVGGFQLKDIQTGTIIHNGQVFPVNKASYDEKIIGRLKNLSFTEASSDDDASKIKEKLADEGWTYIADTHVYAKKGGSTQVLRVIIGAKKTF